MKAPDKAAVAEEPTLARQALELVLASPADARVSALQAIDTATARRDTQEISLGERVLGLVAQHLEDFDAAKSHLERALKLALRTDDGTLVDETRLELAYFLSQQGDSKAALRQLTLARRSGRRSTAPWSIMNEALVLKTLGRWDDALAAYQRALPEFRRSQDRLGEARCLANRAVVQIYRGRLGPAESDLQEANSLFSRLGQGLNQAIVQHNLGYVAARRGDIPEALRRYAEAERGYRLHRDPPLSLAVDRCELLLSAGLTEEAREAAEEGVQEAERYRQPAGLAEARLRLAQASLADGDARAALISAQQAVKAFERQQRVSWKALANWVLLRAQLAGAIGRTPSAKQVRRVAADLAHAGWSTESLQARTVAAQILLQRGSEQDARQDLVIAARGRKAGTAMASVAGWHAEAQLRLLDGNRRGADSALRSGMRRLEEYRGLLQSTDLRTRIAGHAADLARLGIGLAIEEHHAVRSWQWAERFRAGSFRSYSVRPPQDPAMASALSDLRLVNAELGAAVVEQAPTGALRRRQSQLEHHVRDVARRSVPNRNSIQRKTPPLKQLSEVLGSAVLVELLVHDDYLHAVVIRDSRASLHRLGRLEVAERELEMLRFALHRLAGRSLTPRSQEAALSSMEYSARQLDDQLLAPIASLLEGRDAGLGPRRDQASADALLVIVPTGPLHAVPWSALPTCRGRPVVVAPSATSWYYAATRTESASGRAVLIAGPRLPYANQEVQALSSLLTDATILTDADATAARVMASLEGASLAHIAAHGRFRSDNPLFSCLEIEDGALTVYDLERLDVPPELIVLSACDSGLSAVHPGDELMGLAASLLGLGGRSLIASVVPVSDQATTPLMLEMHGRIRSGDGPAAALAGAQRKRSQLGFPADTAAAAAFVCFGAG